jgi:CDP-glucose 4,6-dehydratase
MVSPDPEFWRGRRVVLTGHTGFKGAWLALWLDSLGAKITGLALPPDQSPSLWREIGAGLSIHSIEADIRDAAALTRALVDAPEVVIHMAAQSLVGRGYRDPLETFSTNVIGSAALLNALREMPDLRCILIVTSDKVYRNRSGSGGYREADPLGGDDPYSASKAAQEMVARAFSRSYFMPRSLPLITARAGNVVGGGDWSQDRLIPDIWRSVRSGTPIELRYPDATRPWQHVLDCLNGYLVYIEAAVHRSQNSGLTYPPLLNFGPSAGEVTTVAQLVDAIGPSMGMKQPWRRAEGSHPPETARLEIDADLARRELGWSNKLATTETFNWTADWYRDFDAGKPAAGLCRAQIDRFTELAA